MLANEGEILNYNLERVEQSSSLLHVLLGAIMSMITGINAVVAGHILPVLAGLLCLATLNCYARRHQLWPWPAMLCGSSSSFVYWNFAGLESPLSALLMLLYILSLANCLENFNWRNSLAMVTSGICLQISRPEMVLFTPTLTITACLLVCAQRQSTLKAAAIISTTSVMIAAIICLWRYWYFSDWFPQPVEAKSAGITLAAIQNGIHYAAQAVKNPLTIVQSVIGIFSCLHITWRIYKRQTSITLATMVIAIIGYSMLIMLMGGDWMPAGRLWVPIIPLIAITISYSLYTLLPAKLFTSAMAIILFLNIGSVSVLANDNLAIKGNFSMKRNPGESSPYSFFERQSPDNRANISTLEFLQPLVSKLTNLQPDGLIILSGQMGMIPYHLSLQHPGKLGFTDRNSLIDRKLTDCSYTNGRPRVPQGIDGLNTGFFLKQSEELVNQCGISPPDIIYDLWWHNLIPDTMQMLARRGYTVVFIQQGHISPLQDQLVAIRTDLWGAIGRPEPAILSPESSPIAP